MHDVGVYVPANERASEKIGKKILDSMREEDVDLYWDFVNSVVRNGTGNTNQAIMRTIQSGVNEMTGPASLPHEGEKAFQVMGVDITLNVNDVSLKEVGTVIDIEDPELIAAIDQIASTK